MKFELPKLEYAYDALEPYIDSKTMEIHLNNDQLSSFLETLEESFLVTSDNQNINKNLADLAIFTSYIFKIVSILYDSIITDLSIKSCF